FLTVAGAQAVSACVATADDHHALSGRENVRRSVQRIAFAATILLREKFHGEMNALEFASRDGEVTRLLRTSGEKDRIERRLQLFDRNADADMRVGDEAHAFGNHLLDAAIDEMFLQLEVGNAIAQQATDAVSFLVNHNLVSCPAQLLGCG